MIKYAKIFDEKTGLCEVGLGTNVRYYKSIGMTEMDVEQSEVDYQWYLAEKCPHFTPEEIIDKKKEQVRDIRDRYLADTDKYMICDFPISAEECEKYKAYRQYLRDYTKNDGWFNKDPATFEEWKTEAFLSGGN